MASNATDRKGKRKADPAGSRWSSPELSPSRSSHKEVRRDHHREKKAKLRDGRSEVKTESLESHHSDSKPKLSHRSDVKTDSIKKDRDDPPPERKIKDEPVDEGYQRLDRRDNDRHSTNRHNDHHSSQNDRHPERRQNDVDQMREQRRERQDNDRQRLQQHRGRQVKREEGGEDHPWGGRNNQQAGSVVKEETKAEKEKPTLELSGKLAEDTNTFRGVVIKYVEPPEARKPKKHWRFHPFKDDVALPILHIHRQSAYLIGRHRRVCDFPVDHPSISKQHAALQFRLVPYKREDGRTGRRVSPYIIDLGSGNGTYVNNQRIDPQRYVELFEKDVLKFGFSSRDYVLLHDSSDTGGLENSDDEGE